MPKKVNTKEFIAKSQRIHGDKWDYSLVDYKGSHTKVVIICRKHKAFLQNPNDHLLGSGCPLCGEERRAKSRRSSTEEFVSKAKTVQGDIYDYSKVVYSNRKSEVIITCKLHGEFSQESNSHLQGSGCPSCANLSRGYSRSFFTENPTIIYVLQLTNGLFKVGITKHSVNERYSKKDRELIQEVLLEHTDIGNGDSWELEKLVLRNFSKYKYKGEDVLYSGNTELLTVNPTEFLKTLLEKHSESLLICQ